jgi:hypothetical protein
VGEGGIQGQDRGTGSPVCFQGEGEGGRRVPHRHSQQGVGGRNPRSRDGRMCRLETKCDILKDFVHTTNTSFKFYFLFLNP